MMFAVVTLVHLADSKEELDSDTETLQSIARKHLCQLTTLNWQQADGLVTVLPLGLRGNSKFCVTAKSGANREKFIMGGRRVKRLPPC